MERLSGVEGITRMGRHLHRTPAEWSDLVRRDSDAAAEAIDANATRDRRRGDRLGELTADLREDAADRLRGGKGTIRRP
jgi:hypothetical protein